MRHVGGQHHAQSLSPATHFWGDWGVMNGSRRPSRSTRVPLKGTFKLDLLLWLPCYSMTSTAGGKLASAQSPPELGLIHSIRRQAATDCLCFRRALLPPCLAS